MRMLDKMGVHRRSCDVKRWTMIGPQECQRHSSKAPRPGERASALQIFKNWSAFSPRMIYFSLWELTSSEAPKTDPTWPKFNTPSWCQAVAHDQFSRMPKHNSKAPRSLRTVNGQVHCSSSKTGHCWAPKWFTFSFRKLTSSEAPKTYPTWPKFNTPSWCQTLAHDRPPRMPRQGSKAPRPRERASASQFFKKWAALSRKMIYFSLWELISSEAPKTDPAWPKFNTPSWCQAVAHDQFSRMPKHNSKAPRSLRTVNGQVQCSSSKTGHCWATKWFSFPFGIWLYQRPPKLTQLGPNSTHHHDVKRWPMIGPQECQRHSSKAPRPGERASALQIFKDWSAFSPKMIYYDLLFPLGADFIRGPQNRPTLAQVQDTKHRDYTPAQIHMPGHANRAGGQERLLLATLLLPS